MSAPNEPAPPSVSADEVVKSISTPVHLEYTYTAGRASRTNITPSRKQPSDADGN